MRPLITRLTLTLITAAAVLPSTAGAGEIPPPVKLGAVFSQTGSAAGYGVSQVNGAQLAVDEVNRFAGVGGELALDVRDDASDATKAHDAFGALIKRLAAMVRDGQLLQNRRGGYGVAAKLDLIPGEILANAEGYGFLRPDDGGDDIYLSPMQMRAVLHGDRVLGSIVGLDRRGRREGAIVEVLERRPARLVGRYQEQDGFGVVVPDDRRIHQDVLISRGKEAGARSGQIVVAELTEPPTRERPPMGRVVSVLGERLTASARVVSQGSRMGVYDIDVTNPSGERIAVFRGRSYRMKGKQVVTT